MHEQARFNVLACGRRWGKTRFCLEHVILPALMEGWPVGWFAPTYRLLEEVWHETIRLLRPLKPTISRAERCMRLGVGGRLEFWSTEPRHSGEEESEVARGRKYKVIVYDEAARGRRLRADWTKAIRATLLDYKGTAWFPSTPKGMNFFHTLWARGEAGDDGWASWQMPTVTNPHIPPEEIEAARIELPEDAFAQEFLAKFLDDAVNPFGISAIRACCVPELEPGPIACWGVDLAKARNWTVAIGMDDKGNVRAFQRWRSNWRDTFHRLKAMVGLTPALIDSTGVGDPIVEELKRCCPQADGFLFGLRSKQQLMEGLAMGIHRRLLTFPEGIIRHELEAFQYEYGPTGVTYAAPAGANDDCVDALALAWRCLTMGPKPPELMVIADDDDDEDEVFFSPREDLDRMWTR